jgi:hypothetical protein
MIVPPTPGGLPNFSVDEDNGPLQVCVQVITQPGVAVLGRPVTAILSTEDGTAIGTYMIKLSRRRGGGLYFILINLLREVLDISVNLSMLVSGSRILDI